MSNWSYIITIIFLFFTIILIYLKKYNHLLIIMLPYLTIVFFTDIQNTNQGKEILDLFFIFLLMLYSLISIISKILDKYKSSILIASGNIISISVIWCLILFIDTIINICNLEIFNSTLIINIVNLIVILFLLKKELRNKRFKKIRN